MPLMREIKQILKESAQLKHKYEKIISLPENGISKYRLDVHQFQMIKVTLGLGMVEIFLEWHLMFDLIKYI